LSGPPDPTRPEHCFPPPWSVKDTGGCFVVKASNDRPLVFIYYGEGVARRSLARLLTRNAADGSRSALPSCPSYCGGLDLFD
jgi:hypothetical protein